MSEPIDKELYELCKEVYEKTGWKNTHHLILHLVTPGVKDSEHIGEWHNNGDFDEEDGAYPLYTSDYILEKLPKGIKGNYLNIFSAGISSWYALYGRTTTAKDTGLYGECDTPLKSLLSLTIALHEAGEL